MLHRVWMDHDAGWRVWIDEDGCCKQMKEKLNADHERENRLYKKQMI